MMDGERCRDRDRRRQAIRAGKLNGIDYVEVDDKQTTLTVYFLGSAPKLEKENIRIDGGRRVRGIRITGLQTCVKQDPRADECVKIAVDRPGDFSTYTLRLVKPDAH